jgi:hypothetical protein
LEVPLATTLVVVASEEGACDTVVVVDVVVEVATGTRCEVVEVSTGGLSGVVVVLVVVAGGNVAVVVVVGAVVGVDVDGEGLVVVVTIECSGREFRVKTSTSSSRGLDHIRR